MKDFRVDEKGKYYTSHVSKRAARVVVATLTNVVRGTMHLMLDNRVKDELNNGERFIAITDAQVFDMGGQSRLYETSALLLNKEQVVWIFPQEDSPAEASND